MTECSQPQGALYCNGQYVDHGGNLQSCIDAIRAAVPTITINTSASATGSSSCDNGTCQASGQADASASCAFSPRSAGSANALGAFGVLIGLGAFVSRRRRAR